MIIIWLLMVFIGAVLVLGFGMFLVLLVVAIVRNIHKLHVANEQKYEAEVREYRAGQRKRT